MSTSLCILGATGSVGTQTLDVVRQHPDKFHVTALTAQNNWKLLAQLALKFQPQAVAIGNMGHYQHLKQSLADTTIEVLAGEDGVIEAARVPSQRIMSAIVGIAGLKPTFAALQQGTTVLLANKESLVCGGSVLLDVATQYGATILPVDSEHNALFQIYDAENPSSISKIILTASGGPFRTWHRKQLQKATPEQAVAHPNWNMGAKISVDSATLMNKGLELIEAARLFPRHKKRIDVIVHPQSIIHGLVHYIDGTIKAVMGTPDMKSPIAHTLAWPQRISAPVRELDLIDLQQLTFEAPDVRKFPALRLAYDAMIAGDSATIILNAANEVCVDAFLSREISFMEISQLVEETLHVMDLPAPTTLSDIFTIDQQTRQHVCEKIKARQAA